MRATPVRREPFWSGPFTAPLAERVPADRRPAVVVLIKSVHTAIFVSIAGLILRFTWERVTTQPAQVAAEILLKLGQLGYPA